MGGDGTLHEAVQGVMQRPVEERPCLALLPGGTGDALARDLGIADPSLALKNLREGRPRSIDLAQVHLDGERYYCFSVIGWGAFARINRRAERMRWARGRRYDLAAVVELLSPSLGGDPFLAAVCLTEHTGRGMRLAPGAELDDGQGRLIEVRRGSRTRLLALLTRVHRGRHMESSLVTMAPVQTLVREFGREEHVILDGEARPARRLELAMLPGALSILAPPPPAGP